MSGIITLRTVNNDLYQLQFKVRNGESIFLGEARATREQARQDVDALRRAVLEDGRYAVYRDRRDRFQFTLLGDSGEPLGSSVPFLSPEDLGKAIAELKRGAPQAVLEDLT